MRTKRNHLIIILILAVSLVGWQMLNAQTNVPAAQSGGDEWDMLLEGKDAMPTEPPGRGQGPNFGRGDRDREDRPRGNRSGRGGFGGRVNTDDLMNFLQEHVPALAVAVGYIQVGQTDTGVKMYSSAYTASISDAVLGTDCRKARCQRQP